MTIINELRARNDDLSHRAANVIQEMTAEIERLQADKTAISQTASDYLHEIERLREAQGQINDMRSVLVHQEAEIERLRTEHD